jgi:hypothetical protein
LRNSRILLASKGDPKIANPVQKSLHSHTEHNRRRETPGGWGEQQQQESRLQDFGYGGRAESETEKARNEEPDGARRTTR